MVDADLSVLIDQTPPGGRVVHERVDNALEEPQRFVFVRRNFEYIDPAFTWNNAPEPTEIPRAPGRGLPGRPIDGLIKCELAFDGNADQLADFYPIAQGPFFVSGKLLDLMLRYDADAIDFRKEEVSTKDGVVDFFIVVPKRVIDGVDLDRTTVQVYDDNLAGTFVRRVKFPNGMVFSSAIPSEVHAFWDWHSKNWLWSREFFGACDQAGVRGVSGVKTDARDPGESFNL